MKCTTTLVSCTLFLIAAPIAGGQVPESVIRAAGSNRVEIEQALARVPESQKRGLEFLVLNMPQRDLVSLSAEYLLENTRLAYQARETDLWARDVPEDVFLNAVLPYCSINERRDGWRADFRNRFLPLVKDAKTTGEAATILNRKIFKLLNVRYSTKRTRADQSPYESMETGLASCTGLSILLVDACRAVGVPARFVGTPLWSNKSGNHSWVEVWDNGGWHFTGAAEPAGDRLDEGWFSARAATADRDNPVHAIYTTSFRKTPLTFPCVWDRSVDYVPAVNVTDRYVERKQQTPAGKVHNMFAVRDSAGTRVTAAISILRDNKSVFEGQTNDDRFDTNDHLRVLLTSHAKHVVRVVCNGHLVENEITPTKDDELIWFTLTKAKKLNNKADTIPDSAKQKSADSVSAIRKLEEFLRNSPSDRKPLVEQTFAQTPLSLEHVQAARKLLADDFLTRIRAERQSEMDAKVLQHGDLRMPFYFKSFGRKPADGWSLYISMHGGGGAPTAVNDGQWENQKRLYEPEEGIYLAPRAPTDTWNLWHQGHIDALFLRLIQNMVAFEDVNWNRVYIMGYSAGGDGVYQLAPRMSDHWAAAAMMAGHPNETSPIGLRNVPFALQVGGRDAAYKRNSIAEEWQQKLKELQARDPDGYVHMVKIYPAMGHWMNRQDAIAVPWMAKHTRNPTPNRIVWKQDDITHSVFYWLGVDDEHRKSGNEIIAEVKQQVIDVSSEQVKRLTVCLDDRFIDLEKPVTVVSEGKVLFEGTVDRTIASLEQTLEQSGDPVLTFPASVTVDLPPAFPASLVPSEEIPKYTAVRTATPLKIDGKLDESTWKSATRTSSFVDLISGAETQHQTRSAILWDDDFLYVGFWITEPNVNAKYQQRDDPIYYDNDVELFIAGRDAYYEFEINALGTIYEAFFIWEDAYDSGGFATDPQLKRGVLKSESFNGVGLKTHPRGKRIAFLGYDLPGLQSAVHVDGTLNDDSDTDQGWTVELAIPWKSMQLMARGNKQSLPPKAGDQWRIDLFRFNKNKAPAPAKDSGGWALGRHGIWDSHIPEIFPIVTFADP